ncbi:MAG: archease [Candidatus Omnitrophota bacterium]
MPEKDYKIIEHTADIGIEVRADDLAGLFGKAADAMFDIIVEVSHKSKKTNLVNANCKSIRIKLKAENLEELFVDWLSELLYLYSVKELVFVGFKINKIEETSIEAVAFGEGIAGYKVKTEIKAVTYHELEVKRTASGWQAKVIFDV